MTHKTGGREDVLKLLQADLVPLWQKHGAKLSEAFEADHRALMDQLEALHRRRMQIVSEILDQFREVGL